jgi:hypothetical protein
MPGPTTTTPDLKRRTEGIEREIREIEERPSAAPAAIGQLMRSEDPVIRDIRTEDGIGISVTHREYVQDFLGTSDYDFNSYGVSPANPELFPWLSRLAHSYQFFRFKKLMFHLKTSVSTQVGGVNMMTFIYDAAALGPRDKASMLNAQGASREVAWKNLTLHVPVNKLRQLSKRNVGKGFQLSVNDTSDIVQAENGETITDVRFEQAGQLFIATDGFSTSVTAGEIWVDYEIELSVPQTGKDSVASCSVYGDTSTGVTNLRPLSLSELKWRAVPGGVALVNATVAADVTGQGYFLINAPGEYYMTIINFGTVLLTPTVVPGIVNSFDLIVAVCDAPATTCITEFLLTVRDVDERFGIFIGSTTITETRLTLAEVAPASISLT